MKIQEIQIEKIKPNPFNERRHIESVGNLYKKMLDKGFWGSLLARPRNGHYEIAFGERRLKAAKLAGLKTIPLQIEEINDQNMREATTIENAHREDVDPIERAKHLAKYQKDYEMSERDMAEVFGIPYQTVGDLLNLINLPAGGQKKISEGKIGWTIAREANKVGGEKMINTAIKHNLKRDEVVAIGKAIEEHPDYKEKLLARKIKPEEIEMEKLFTKAFKKDKTVGDIADLLYKTLWRVPEALEEYKTLRDEVSRPHRVMIDDAFLKIAELAPKIKELIK